MRSGPLPAHPPICHQEMPNGRKKAMNAGQTVENPVTGERLTFHATAAPTDGEYVSFEALITPGGTLASAHLHPYQTERFELVSGTLTMRVGARKFEAKAGDVVVIEPGTPHNFWHTTREAV